MIRIFLIISALVMATAVHIKAQTTTDDEYFHVPEVQIGADGKGTVEVWLNTPNDDVTEFQMDIYLPPGFTITKNRAGNFIFTFNTDDDVTVDHTMASGYHENGDFTRIVGATFSQTAFLPGDHKFFSFTIVAPEGFDKPAEASLRKVLIARDDEPYKGPINFTIVPYNYTTGVDEVTADNDMDDKPVYDLQGRRVSRPLAPGIYVSDGHKFIVH